MTGVERTCAEG